MRFNYWLLFLLLLLCCVFCWFVYLSGLPIEKHEEFTTMEISNTRIQHKMFI